MRQMIPIGEYGYDGGATARPDLKRMFGQQQPIQATFPGATPYADTPQYMPPPIKNSSTPPLAPTISPGGDGRKDVGQYDERDPIYSGDSGDSGSMGGGSLGSSIKGVMSGIKDEAASGGKEILSSLIGA